MALCRHRMDTSAPCALDSASWISWRVYVFSYEGTIPASARVYPDVRDILSFGSGFSKRSEMRTLYVGRPWKSSTVLSK